MARLAKYFITQRGHTAVSDATGGRECLSAMCVNTEQGLLVWAIPASIMLVSDVLSMVLVVEHTIL